MCDCENDWCSFSNEREITARQEYRCCECDGVIAVGQKYVYGVSKWEVAGFGWRRMCLQCQKDWEELLDRAYENGHDLCECIGELKKSIGEAIDLGYIDEGHPLFLGWFDAIKRGNETCGFPETVIDRSDHRQRWLFK